MPPPTKVQQVLQTYGSDYYDIQVVRLGRLDGVTVQTGTDGVLWARQWNGKEIQLINQAFIAADFDKRVFAGKKRRQSTVKWFILDSMEDYLVPASGGRIGYHEKQHEIDQPDMLPVDRRQLISMSLLVSDGVNWKVQLYGGVFPSLTGMTIVLPNVYDMTAYINTTGAYYVAFHCDDAGNVYRVQGTDFGDPLAGGVAYIPLPPPGRYLIGYIAFYAGQTKLQNSDIRVIMPMGIIAKTAGFQLGEAPVGTPDDPDLIGFYDTTTSLLNAITYRNFLQLIKNWVNPLTQDLRMYRWNGATSQTTFELPDIGERVLQVSLNGLAEDPFNYSLSSDGTQIILGAALASATLVTAQYVVRKM